MHLRRIWIDLRRTFVELRGIWIDPRAILVDLRAIFVERNPTKVEGIAKSIASSGAGALKISAFSGRRG
jgi:hypothetical protein